MLSSPFMPVDPHEDGDGGAGDTKRDVQADEAQPDNNKKDELDDGYNADNDEMGGG